MGKEGCWKGLGGGRGWKGVKGESGGAYPELGRGGFGEGLVAVEDFDGEEEEELEERREVGLEEDVGVLGHDLVDEGDAVQGDFRVGFGFCRGMVNN